MLDPAAQAARFYPARKKSKIGPRRPSCANSDAGNKDRGGENGITRAPAQTYSKSMMCCVEEEIKTHTERVESGNPIFHGQACPHCGNDSQLKKKLKVSPRA